MSDLIFSWMNYAQSTDDIKEQIIDAMGLNDLDSMTWRRQAASFDGAPADVILRFFRDLSWEALVEVWDKHLPVKARPKAEKMLQYEARVKLGLAKKAKFRCLA